MKPALNLKNVIVEKRAIKLDPVTLRLPMPMSVNNLFATYNGHRIPTERYRTWRAEAANCIGLLGRPHISGPVEVSITFEEKSRSCDLDNLAKAPLDVLVFMGVIDGDHSKIVRKLTLEWGVEKGATVRIVPHVRAA